MHKTCDSSLLAELHIQVSPTKLEQQEVDKQILHVNNMLCTINTYGDFDSSPVYWILII